MIKSSVPTSGFYVPANQRSNATFSLQFDWNGGVDLAAYISVVEALKFRNWLGGERKIITYCHEMAMKGGKRLAEILGTKVMDSTGELTCNMANVQLPLEPHIMPSLPLIIEFNRKMLEEHKVSCSPFYHNNSWWVRCCANVWTEVDDFDKLGKALLIICPELTKEFGSS